MTIAQILGAMSPYKTMSHATLYKQLRALKIKPVSRKRQIPQHYPANTAERVLKHYGIKAQFNGYTDGTNGNGPRHGSKLLAA